MVWKWRRGKTWWATSRSSKSSLYIITVLAGTAGWKDQFGTGVWIPFSACPTISLPFVVHTNHISTIHYSFAERSSGRNPTSKPLKPSSSNAATTSKPSRTASQHSTTKDAPGNSSAVSRTPSRSSDSGRIKVTKLSSTTVTLPTTWAQKPPVCAIQIHTYFITDKNKSDIRTINWGTTSDTHFWSVADCSTDISMVFYDIHPGRVLQECRSSRDCRCSIMFSFNLDLCRIIERPRYSCWRARCRRNEDCRPTRTLRSRTRHRNTGWARIRSCRSVYNEYRHNYSICNLQFANEAPAVMQLFHSHGISCDRIETEALKISAHQPSNPNKDEPLKVYNDMLESLGRFSIPILLYIDHRT